MTPDIPALELRDVTVVSMRDTAFAVVEGVNWSVAAGEFWVVAGQEHSGKSDLLMMAAGLMPPAAGTCKLFGGETRDFGGSEPAQRRRAGFVFQGGQLFNHLTVWENITLSLRYQHDLPAAAAKNETRTLVEALELAPLADVTPASIAPNWRQRAALARALALKPEVLLLDNPLAGLGARHLLWWTRFLDQLWRGHELFGGKPMTLVAAADDLRPWRHASRKYAVLCDKKLVPLGRWNDVETADDSRVRELLTAPVEAGVQ